MQNTTRKERVKVWSLECLGRVQLMHATYITQKFPKHAHEGFAIGVIEHGALGFYYRGENVVASAGAINLANADEIHTGQAATNDGWTYRMFYFGEEILRRATCEISGRTQNVPYFPAGVLHDRTLGAAIHSLHVRLEADGSSSLEMESEFLCMLAELIARYSDAPPPLERIGSERRAVRRVREYIAENLSENIPLGELASIAGLSPYHFLRVFGREVGLPPHAYLTQERIRRAKHLLAQGQSPAATALETGFSDQSHLTRHFKRITGLTPAQYSKIVQD
ncbi:MAG: AraC family transcriptional regulator [Desulfobacteraceae bacterium]|nr:AraC family transcriptional regulator [Desulfobacteraceae bacterium]